MATITVIQTNKGYMCKVDNSLIENDHGFTCMPRTYRSITGAICDAFFDNSRLLDSASVEQLKQICEILNVELVLPTSQNGDNTND